MARDPTELLSRAPVIPVLTIERVADAVPLARALVAGGLPVLEITLRTAVALDAAIRIAAKVPDAVVGLGTVTQVPDIRTALASGARFLVSPGTPSELAHALARAPVPVLPGCATVSEAMALAALGFSVLKFFPAEPSGGIAFLKAIAAPLPHIRFCPTGGIDPAQRRRLSGPAQRDRRRRLVGRAAGRHRCGRFRPRHGACPGGDEARIPTTRTGRSPVIVMCSRR